MSGGVGGLNGPITVNGGSDSYDRPLAFDAPVAFDTGLYAPTSETLASLRKRVMILLGFATMADAPPAGMQDTINEFLRLAQSQKYWDYPILRTERWWAWQLTAGQRFYDVPVSGLDALEFRRISEAWIADNGGIAASMWGASKALALGAYILATAPNPLWFKVTTAGTTGTVEPTWPTNAAGTVVDGTVTFTAVPPPAAVWSPLQRGIHPSRYTLATSARPDSYELTDALELWPAPEKSYVVYLRGHLGLRRFTQDTDAPTIDPDVLLTFATALAKAHYRHPDANNYAQMAAGLERRLTAGAHAGKRYIPGPNNAGMAGCDDARSEPMPRATWR